ncbi:hypothetical protein CC78DRAFT_611502 [Lojkania enalia]|uniref:Uncharacterized protein n=1 Tax=Lojkania enalia TaxID=147567 RepID=A0A9P4NCE2_9PLEO|nr:hypothetical protein CC78DRAFT_611502 [Didymosphaeria enalia]
MFSTYKNPPNHAHSPRHFTSKDEMVEDISDRLLGSGLDDYPAHSCAGQSQAPAPLIRFLVIFLFLYISVLETINFIYSKSNPLASFKNTEEELPQRPDSNYIIPSSILTYQRRSEWSELQYPWTLPPGDSLDAIWGRLLSAQNIRVTEEEFKAFVPNATNGVQTLDGDYVGVIGIYHHLHCLDSIRRVIRWDYYGPRATEKAIEEGVYTKEHTDHCIDSIRQALMCHPNTAFYAAHWIMSEKGPKADLDSTSGAMHKCVKWESLDQWAKERAMSQSTARYRPSPFHGKHNGMHGA